MRFLFLFLLPNGLGNPVSFLFGMARANHDLSVDGFGAIVFAIGDQNRPSFGFASDGSRLLGLCGQYNQQEWRCQQGEGSAGRKMGDGDAP